MSQECTCNCSQCPPWWVTMGFKPPLQITSTTPAAPAAPAAPKEPTATTVAAPTQTTQPAQSSSGGSSLLGGLGNILTGGLASLF